jgi:hypothetical protein
LRLIAVCVVAAAVAIEIFAWPSYPSLKSICGLIESRNRVPERWASPHRGAIILVSGNLYGGAEGMFALECSCGAVHPLVQVSPPPAWLPASPVWKRLTNNDPLHVDKIVPVQMLARVISEEQGCFNLGMIIQPLATRFTGPYCRGPVGFGNLPGRVHPQITQMSADKRP